MSKISDSEIREHIVADNIMNQQLFGYFSSIGKEKINAVLAFNSKATDEEKVANPWLIAATDSYYQAEKRVMMVGQDSFGWYGEDEMKGEFNPKFPIKNLMSLYDLFVNKDHGYNSPFWNKYKELLNLCTTKGIGLIQTNISFLGYMQQKAGMNRELNSIFKDVLLDEIRILKPNLILFFCGPEYDKHINDRLGKNEQERVLSNVDERKFCELRFSDPKVIDTLNGAKVYRTYHPSYLQRCSKNEWVKQVNEAIISSVERL